jgi:hypothetical protein
MAQKVVRFSSGDQFSEEFLQLIDLNKEERGLFQDSLLPEVAYLLDASNEKSWIELSNNLLRKRMEAQNWEHLLRLVRYVGQNEEVGTFEKLVEHLALYSKQNPSTRIKEYLYRLYLNEVSHLFSDANGIVWKAPYAYWTLSFVDGVPIFKIQDADLIGTYGEDSTTIMTTSMVYYPVDAQLHGEGGIVFWSRAGLADDELYAELDRWTIDITKPFYNADSVVVHSSQYVMEPMLGRLEERMSSRSADNARFPQFTSYSFDYHLPNIFPEVHFVGGIGIAGAQFYGTAPENENAALKFSYNTDTVLSLFSRRFNFNDSLLSSGRAEVVAHLGKDSIYHPYCQMRFDPRIGQIRLTRFETGLGLSPFINTYHSMDMSVDQLIWNQGTPKISFRNLNLGSEQAAVFESRQYFRITRMEQLAGFQQNHPLMELRDASYSFGYENMPVESLIRALRMPKEQGEAFLFRMAIMGFATFDVEQGLYSLNERLFEYLDNWTGKRDYDVIQFVSRVPTGDNAQLSLLNYEMDIAGVGRIAVSDSQRVDLYPLGGKLTMREGMDFIFDGRINAGLFSYWGQDYGFDYDEFKIHMPQVDSMRFKVKEFNPPPGELAALVNVQTVLQNLQGELLIDQPNNKSSREYYPEFPIFRALNNSYVYYDHPSIHDGVYDRSRFYMALEPFTIDSLDNTTTDGIVFDATFHSADIFPVFEQPLIVMEDYSLGFKKSMLPTQTYKGIGSFEGDIALSNQGLHATGRIDYIQSTTICSDILFFPEEAKGRAQQFTIAESTQGQGYPNATGVDNPFNWQPYQGQITAKTRNTPFDMYGEPEVVAEGSLTYGNRGLFGKGELRYYTAKHNSDDEGYQFFRRGFTSTLQDFRVKTALSDEQWAFQMISASADINFDDQKGLFDKIDSYSTIDFPANQYQAYMDHAEWAMDKQTVDIKHNEEGASYMVSTHPLQDSLDFEAAYARFQLRPSILEAFEVAKIDVADASILPDSGHVIIRRNAEMDPLKNSKIIANRFSRLHNFYDATSRIKGKNSYTANGMYDYVDEDGMQWPLHFHSIRPDTADMTIADATVEEKDDFFISPYFGYRGGIRLMADQSMLHFKGSILIQHACKNLQTTWFDIDTDIEPTDIVIELPINDPLKLRDNTFNGIYISQDSLGGHSNFLSKYADRADIEVLSATGVLFYDREEKGYVITTLEKLLDYTLPDPYLVFHNYDCDLYGTGTLAVLENTGLVESRMAGAVTHDLNTDEVIVDAVWSIDAPLNKDAWEAVASIFTKGTNATRSYDKAYEQGVFGLLGSKEGQKYLANIASHEVDGKFPKDFRKSIVLNEVNLEYNGRFKTFQSNAEAGIQSIYGVPVYGKVDALIEIKNRRRGGEFTVYLYDGNDYIYMNFKGIVMSLRSSDDLFNESILAKDASDRSVKAKGDEPAFTYNLAGKGKIMLLKRRFGIEE